MMPSKEYARIYEEIRELMAKGQYAAASFATRELQSFAVTRGQFVKLAALQVFLEQKLGSSQAEGEKFH